jgi:hypothetical protein
MAAKKKSSGVPATEAKFPYTNKPASLRKMLKAIPSRPKPTKVNEGLLKSWEFRDTNDRSIIRVLKAVRLLNGSNEPTDVYTKFMDLVGGPPVLGAEITFPNFSTGLPFFNSAALIRGQISESAISMFLNALTSNFIPTPYNIQRRRFDCESFELTVSSWREGMKWRFPFWK